MIRVMDIIIFIFAIFTISVLIVPWKHVWFLGNGLCILFVGIGLLIFAGPPDGGPYGDDSQELAEGLYGVVGAIIAAPFLLRFIVHAVRYANAKDAPTIAPWP